MRVVQFIDTLQSGGKERQLVELLKGLTQSPGVECELIVMSNTVHYSYLENLDLPIHHLLRKSRRDPRIFVQLIRLLKEIQPDILHSWSSMCSVYALPAVKLLNIKFVNGFLRNAPPSSTRRDKTWLRSKITFPFSDVILANSKAGLLAYNAPGQTGKYIYNGFDFQRLVNLESSEAIRAKYKLTTKFIIGMVASFSENKDFQTFINSAQIICRKRKDTSFLAIGDGKHREAIQKTVPAEYKNLIKFPGKVKNVESLVQVMTIGVLCSNAHIHGEGISNSIMEYMALGKPVVATDCGGNKELVQHGKSGFLVRNTDAEDLAERILFLLDHADYLKNFGETGRRRLRKEFKLECLTDKHISLYKGILY